MATNVELPQLGESVVEATIGQWLVKEGDPVTVDQPLVEVTTDKADAELPSPVAGVVEKILVPEGEVVTVGTELARISEGASAEAPSPASRPAEPAAQSREAAEARTMPSPTPASDGGRGAPRATPVAERMAAERGIDLAGVEGSGPSGRVMKHDVAGRRTASERLADREPSPEPARSHPPASRPAPAPPAARAPGSLPPYMVYELEEGDRVIPMTPLRKIVAEHMVLSKQTSPHVGTVAEIDMSGVFRARDAHKRSFQETHGFSLTFLPFIVQATVRALREFPRLNASVVEEAIVEKKALHVGIAVETPKGLVVPVVRHADRLSLTGIADTIEDLSQRARNRKLSPDELKGGTFTISNPGRTGNLYGFAIINQPQVGILRMGEITKRPVVRSLDGEDAIVIRPMMHMALSYDHRAVDGAPANGFLYRVKELLEEAEFDL